MKTIKTHDWGFKFIYRSDARLSMLGDMFHEGNYVISYSGDDVITEDGEEEGRNWCAQPRGRD